MILLRFGINQEQTIVQNKDTQDFQQNSYGCIVHHSNHEGDDKQHGIINT
jgi:hypothetical protein